MIYSNITKIVEPDDRLLVLYGQGHSKILGRLLQDDPEIDVIDISGYLEEDTVAKN